MNGKELKVLLEKCIANGRCEFMTYGDFGKKFGLGDFPPSWANRQTLDDAAERCKADRKIYNLDLTFLIRSSNKRFPYPSVIDGRPFDKLNPEPQIFRARQVADEIIKRFGPGTPNPY